MVQKCLLWSLIFASFQTHGQIARQTSHNKGAKIAIKMLVSGDLKGEYSFEGPIGSRIQASGAVEQNSVCEFSSVFRKLKYRGENALEAWLHLNCAFEKQNEIEKQNNMLAKQNNSPEMQKHTYKIHRIYLTISSLLQRPQKIKLPMLAENLKNVQLEFAELSLK